MKTACCAILAGGLSRRMGQDKALLTVDGISLLELLVSDLVKHHYQAVICADNQAYNLPFNVTYLADALSDKQGALSAILSALRYARQHAYSGIYVFSCDILIKPSLVIQQIVQQKSSDTLIAYCATEEKSFPLLAYYSIAIIDLLEAYLLAGNRRVMVFIKQLAAQVITVPNQWQVLCNFNTAVEFDQALQYRKQYETHTS